MLGPAGVTGFSIKGSVVSWCAHCPGISNHVSFGSSSATIPNIAPKSSGFRDIFKEELLSFSNLAVVSKRPSSSYLRIGEKGTNCI